MRSAAPYESDSTSTRFSTLKGANMVAATLYENVDFGGRAFDINVGESIPVIPPPLSRGTSSIRVYFGWITFWESQGYNAGGDQLWVAAPPAGKMWSFPNLHGFHRPHGNNHWGDRIWAVSHSHEPLGDNDNRTIVHPDGHVTNGNSLVLDSQIVDRVQRGLVLAESQR